MMKALAAGRIKDFLAGISATEAEAVLATVLADLTDEQVKTIAKVTAAELDRRWPNPQSH